MKMIYRKLPKTASLPVTCHPLAGSPGLRLLFFSLDGRSAAHNETDHKKNQKDNEQNPCNLGRGTGDAAESQNPGNQSDDKKSNAPT
jgi:hypothetical protein